MGELISLSDIRERHAGTQGETRRFARTVFSFDLAQPETYLAAERVDRAFTGVRWQPVDASVLPAGAERDPLAVQDDVERRAAALGLPLVWPEPFPADAGPAMRVAAAACELGRGAAFVLAASRLAFCGGFDLRDPEVLAEAAAAASLPLEVCLDAVADARRDLAMAEAARALAPLRADELPALRLGRVLFGGEDRLPEALAAMTAAGPRGTRRPATA